MIKKYILNSATDKIHRPVCCAIFMVMQSSKERTGASEKAGMSNISD